ncbi:MAG: glutamine-hydrolyzing carbamoyl-phosphate synthase small subunit [Chloroflexi bacterium]|nr:glutamine-hydrolyzing carbamoyl-phosphate synthase small subunit [Chloroflexota bacterium]
MSDADTYPHALLALEDGKVFFGRAFGSAKDAAGELCFNTSMTGYQEICTDPSYRGQIVTLTYPLINNYGVTPVDMESVNPWLSGLVVRELCTHPSNWRATDELDAFLADNNIPGIFGLDTRAITQHLRTYGFKRAVLAVAPPDVLPDDAYDPYLWSSGRTTGIESYVNDCVARARHVTPLSDHDVVGEVSVNSGEHTSHAPWEPWQLPPQSAAQKRLVLIDTGGKHNIARSLTSRGAEVLWVPYGTRYEEICSLDPDGIVVCNGPGDPEVGAVAATVETTARLMHRYPMLGICLGHQIIALAAGARASRLKFGHRGANHPVQDTESGKVHITTQNHGFQVDASSIPEESGFRVSHISLNDGSVEGLRHQDLPILSVQYHPEACPGPQDNQYVFDEFVELLS